MSHPIEPQNQNLLNRWKCSRRLSEFSTFGIGGPVSYFLEVHSIEEMEKALCIAREEKIPFLILGKGSNCLFSDQGFQGLAILNKIDFCEFENTRIHVGSGYHFSLLGVQSARKNLSGLEFASGIPATVGGAVFMNAGANGGDTFGCLESVLYLHADGTKKEYKKEELSFGYRTTSFQTMQGAILSAKFVLQENPQARPSQLKIIDYRMKTQPYKDKSAGCVFRNPKEGVSAGALIERCGLKGFSVGDAKVSEMHANFIVNTGAASAQDVKELIAVVQKTVLEKAGFHLETEIRFLG